MNKDLEKKILEVADLIYNTGYTAGSAENGPIGYDKGYKYGNKIGYDQGLNDAWECARKIYQDLSIDECIEIFEGKSWFDYNASEVIAKIKEYEEKQKMVEDAEIKVGDEVIYCGGGAHDGSVGVVLGAEKDWREVRFKSSWNCVGVCKDALTKTNRHFSQIEEVLEQMKGE